MRGLSYIVPETRTKAHKMDTTKWKSVLVPVEVYRELKILSAIEGRTISGQLRFMFDQYSKLKSVGGSVPRTEDTFRNRRQNH